MSDQDSAEVSRVRVDGMRIVALRRSVTFGEDELGEIIPGLYDSLYAALPEDTADRQGHNVIAYQPTGPSSADMWVGRQWNDEEIPPTCEALEIPAGEAASTRHVGCYGELPSVHQRVHAWMRAHGYSQVHLNSEVYGDWSDRPEERVTDVYYLLPRSPGTVA